MGYGYICKCPNCGYTLSAFLGKRVETEEPNEDTECKVYCCEECGHYEVLAANEQPCCIRCQGRLHAIGEFDEKLFGGELKCPNCLEPLAAESLLQERAWHTQQRYRRSIERTTAPLKTDSDRYITFGCYPQGPNAEIRPIIWQILKREQGKILLISRNCLDNNLYHDVEEDTTWEKCYLRKWLNREFLNTAFAKPQQNRILTTDIVTDGIAVQDKIFLLSLEEVKGMLGYTSCEQRAQYKGIEVCEPTEYAIGFRKAVANENSISWWLRSPGRTNASAAYVDRDYFDDSGDEFYEEHGIRPAMWIAEKGSTGE